MRATPQVSVVIPTHNEGPWLARTVESILAAKTEIPYEIVVVNDACTDGSIQTVAPKNKVRVVCTGSDADLVVAKNLGARAAVGRYICFADSHVLVQNNWLDCLCETSAQYPYGALISCRIADVCQLSARVEPDSYAYTLYNRKLQTGWLLHQTRERSRPYFEPLTPGGLMFVAKAHFFHLGGFDIALQKWGAQDIQISLQNYYFGGENVVDPRVIIYHYFKNTSFRPRSFLVSKLEYASNRLYVAAAYLPRQYYIPVRDTLAMSEAEEFVVSQARRLQQLRRKFVRGFEEWVAQFPDELDRFVQDCKLASHPDGPQEVDCPVR